MLAQLGSSQTLTHRSIRVEKLAENLGREKNMNRRLLKLNRSHFQNINRVYSKVLKAKTKLNSA